MPVETKVKAGTAAGAAAGLLLWALGRYVFRGACLLYTSDAADE